LDTRKPASYLQRISRSPVTHIYAHSVFQQICTWSASDLHRVFLDVQGILAEKAHFIYSGRTGSCDIFMLPGHQTQVVVIGHYWNRLAAPTCFPQKVSKGILGAGSRKDRFPVVASVNDVGWASPFGPEAMRQFPWGDVGFLEGLGGGSP
jgi:hypothetical protein